MSSTLPLRLRRNALSLALLACIQPGLSLAQQDVRPQPLSPEALDALQDPNLLLTRAGAFDPRLQQLDSRAVGLIAQRSSRYAIVQFDQGFVASGQDMAAWLRKHGLDVIEHLPQRAWQVRLNGASLNALAQMAGVRFIGGTPSILRLDPSLWPSERDSTLQSTDGGNAIRIFGYDGVSADALALLTRKYAPNARVTVRTNDPTLPFIDVSLSNAAGQEVDTLLQAEDVRWIAPRLRDELANNNAVGPMQNNTASTNPTGNGAWTPIFNRGLTGSGQVVSISDSGLDRNEDWFVDIDFGAGIQRFITPAEATVPPALGTTHPNAKIYAYWVQPGATAYDNNQTCTSNPTGFHGTHVSGTVAGDRLSTTTPSTAARDSGDGMAPGAQILFQDVGNDTSGCLSITNFSGTLKQAEDAGAGLHSASWGNSSAGAYGGNDASADNATRIERDLVAVIAAGNAGPGAGSIGSPGVAKNVITVGALGSGNSTTIASFSSRGPTDDNRIKPDIVAPGSSTVSAAGDTTNGDTVESGVTSSKSGTSMATPTISGAATLARQYLMDGFYPRGEITAEDAYRPSGMVMKALLLNSTAVIGTTWPGNTFGWGRLWLEHSLYFNSDIGAGADARRLRIWERTDDTGLATGETHEYVISNVGAGQEFRATLTWFDVAGALGSAINIVNNLDLEVIGPGGTYLGNVTSSAVSVTGGSADSRNTVEQVRFTAPTDGSYTLRVKGTSVPGDGSLGSARQGYGLVASGAFALPDAAPLAAPASMNVASNNTSGVQVQGGSVGSASSYQLYRADGLCGDVSSEDFRLAQHGNSSTLTDDLTIGGFAYAYRMRAVGGDIEGNASSCVDTVSLDSCDLPPQLALSPADVDASHVTCRVALDWNDSTSRCPTASGVNYRVERASTPNMAGATEIATGLSSSALNDDSVIQDQVNFYRLSTEDSLGNEITDTRIIAATPSGPQGPSAGDFLDDVDNRAYAVLQAPWQYSTVASAGSYSYHNAPDGSTYSANTCAYLTLPPLTVGDAGSLSFKARFDLEAEWDGVVLEISTDGGSNWSTLTPNGGYPSSFAQTGSPAVNACGYPASQAAFSGSSAGQFVSYNANLAAYAGDTVQLRWAFSSDPGSEEAGFYLDEIRVQSTFNVLFKSGFEAGELPGSGGTLDVPACTVAP
ncbi:MAG: Serine protease AprX [Alphaproteobacteria bacterium ADurb.BinA280]|nr:MAG: Serine protease AprX [Alphaproteobacteria bacterium ADurb.BinA280]